jgi:hypothetical protein
MNDIKATVPSYDQIYANYMYYLSLTGIQEYPWYETANEYLREVAEFLRVDFETVVYTTASLAVRIKWINKLVNGTIKYPNIDAAVRMIYGVLTGRDYDDIVKGIAVYDARGMLS